MPSILIVDDEPGVRSALGGVLRDEGYDVDAVDSGESCLERLGRQLYDVVVLDIWLPGMDGLATLARMRERLQPVHSRQPDVEHDDVVPMSCEALEARLAAVHGVHVVSLVAQHAPQRASDTRLVVDDQNGRHFNTAAPR